MLLRHLGSALLFWVVTVVVAGAASVPYRDVSPPEAEALLREKSGVYLLDVRTPGEYMQARIAGAHLIPIDQIVARIQEIPRERPIVVYCAVGSRSSQVAGYLGGVGYREVYNVSGGIMGWQVRGYPVLRGAP